MLVVVVVCCCCLFSIRSASDVFFFSTKFLHKFGMVEFVVTLLVFLLFNFIFFSISSVLILTFFSDSVPVLGDGVPRVVPLVVGPEVEAAAVLSSCCSVKEGEGGDVVLGLGGDRVALLLGHGGCFFVLRPPRLAACGGDGREGGARGGDAEEHVLLYGPAVVVTSVLSDDCEEGAPRGGGGEHELLVGHVVEAAVVLAVPGLGEGGVAVFLGGGGGDDEEHVLMDGPAVVVTSFLSDDCEEGTLEGGGGEHELLPGHVVEAAVVLAVPGLGDGGVAVLLGGGGGSDVLRPLSSSVLVLGGGGDCEGGTRGGGDEGNIPMASVSVSGPLFRDFVVPWVGEGGTNTVVGIVLLVVGSDWVLGSDEGVHVGLPLAIQPVPLLSVLVVGRCGGPLGGRGRFSSDKSL